MIYQRKCSLCGTELKENGMYNIAHKMIKHLKDIHPKEWQNRQTLTHLVTQAKQNVDAFDRTIWGSIIF